jgi:isopenicillin-N epimerase
MDLASHWTLDPAIAFLNHGSFGACPSTVLEAQREFRTRLEHEPVRFMLRELEPLMLEARTTLGTLIGADPDDLAFMTNATSGVNTVLRSLRFEPGDELLTTDHEYNACKNALDFAASLSGARVVVAKVPFPLAHRDDVTRAVLERVTPRTRLVLIDHVTSPTALVFPIAEIVAELRARGIDTLVDGAHAPGMVPLDLRAIGAAYYTGNLHKWLCTPKGCAFLFVQRERQTAIRPLVISHGANSPRRDQTRFRIEFDWTGTSDPTPFLCVPAAVRFLASLDERGIAAHMAANRSLALAARDVLAKTLAVPHPCPDDMIGSMAALPIADGAHTTQPSAFTTDPLQDELFARGIEVPIVPWPAPPRRLVRVSAQRYNALSQYQRLGEVLRELLG